MTDGKKTPAIGDDPTDGAAVDRALREAFYDVVREHRAAGLPVLIWEDGRVVPVAPDELPLEEQ